MSISSFPKQLSDKLCPRCVGPPATASPASPYRRGSWEGPKLPWCPVFRHPARGEMGQGWEELKSHSSPLIAHVLDPHIWASAFTCRVSPPLLGLHPSLQRTPQPVLPLPSPLPLSPYTSRSSPKYHLPFTDDPKPRNNHLVWFFTCHHWRIFSPSPTQPGQRIPLVSMPFWIG